MTRYNRRQSSRIQSTIKDYFVPILAGILLLVLVYSFFNNDEAANTSSTQTENRTPTTLTFGSADTQADIIYPGDTKESASAASLLYKGETLIVKQGTITLKTPEKNSINLNKMAKFQYNEDGSYTLFSSDAWVELGSESTISMQYATISAPASSVLSLSQNEAGSTIYVLGGSAKVTNLGKVSTSLVKGQKISIPQAQAASTEIDLSSEKGSIDSYFKGSDWFIENEGHLVLMKEEENTSGSGSETASGNTVKTASGVYISFSTLRDEMSIESSSLTINGSILSDEVDSISVNNKQVSINSSSKTFSLAGVSLPNTLNDLVVKIYDTQKNILEKKVYTIYTSKPTGESDVGETSPTNNTPVSSTNLEVDPSAFGFTEPSNTGKFTTTSGEITIRGYTSAKGITAVQVNGFPLSSFNGSTWRYHAFSRFETLEEGTNQYKVDYFINGKVVYSDYYTIVKKASSSNNTVIPATPVRSSTPASTTEETTVSAGSGASSTQE